MTNIKTSENIRLNGLRLSDQALRLGLILLLIPTLAMAEWKVITHTDINSDTETQVAYTENEDGYSLEIYKDSVGAIRSRFSLNTALDMFIKRSCPTYQIDTRLLDNRSINDAPCLTDLAWSEFILGYISDNNVASARLNALMNGSTITFRFMLDNGSYKETQFSLAGSKRATLSVIGDDINITP
jgi:hypothetical protein